MDANADPSVTPTPSEGPASKPESDTSRLFVSAIRQAQVPLAALVALLNPDQEGSCCWHDGRAPWADLWNGEPSVQEAGRRAHQARLQPGVVQQLVGTVACLDEPVDVDPAEVSQRGVFHRDCASEHMTFDGLAHPGEKAGRYRVWAIEFISAGLVTAPVSGNSGEGTLSGWIVVHAKLEGFEEPTNQGWLDDRRRELDVFNIRQNVSGLAVPMGGYPDDEDVDFFGAVADRLLTPSGFMLAADQDQQINYVCALARLSSSKEEARRPEEVDNEIVLPLAAAEDLGRQQSFPAQVLRTTDGAPGLSFSYRTYAASSQRLTYVISNDDSHGIVNYFVDVYPAFLLCVIQDSQLTRISQPMLQGDFFHRERATGEQVIVWERVLSTQKEYYAFKSQYWWARWGRRGAGVLLVPAIQRYWRLDELVTQLDSEFRDYGGMATAESASGRAQEQERWRRLATTASVIVGGMSIVGSWAALASSEILGNSGREALMKSIAVVISALSLLLIASSELDRRRRPTGEPDRRARRAFDMARVLLLVGVMAPMVVFVTSSFAVAGCALLASGVAVVFAISRLLRDTGTVRG